VTACARDCSGGGIAFTTVDPGCYAFSQSSALYECNSNFNMRGAQKALHKEALVDRAAEDAKELENVQ
jgi:hypothetical protein